MIGLGQQPSTSSQYRTVALSADEARMFVRIVEGITAFAKDFALEFYSYCPPDRWKDTLDAAGAGVHEIETQLAAGQSPVLVSATVLTSIMDLEECVSGSRNERLQSAKWALGISAAGAAIQTIFGVSWLALPAYIASLAIVLGKPLFEMVKRNPAEPFKPDVFPATE